jgi:coenzyme F420-reducing hydrogenase gamma subunit
MKYLGIEPKRPKVGVFDFTGCEGCQLQLANKEDSLVDFLGTVEIASFREISSDGNGECDIALVDGAVSRQDEIDRLVRIRETSSTLVALGSCACFGGVNSMKNDLDLDQAGREVYGDNPPETMPTKAIREVVPVDLEIPGCPVNKDEVERVFQHLIFDVPYRPPVYPVCVECKQRFTVCVFQLGQICLGPITRGGCNAPCPAGGLGCWGCRGPAADPNYDEMLALAARHGHDDSEIKERLHFFGAFQGVL